MWWESTPVITLSYVRVLIGWLVQENLVGFEEFSCPAMREPVRWTKCQRTSRASKSWKQPLKEMSTLVLQLQGTEISQQSWVWKKTLTSKKEHSHDSTLTLTLWDTTQMTQWSWACRNAENINMYCFKLLNL